MKFGKRTFAAVLLALSVCITFLAAAKLYVESVSDGDINGGDYGINLRVSGDYGSIFATDLSVTNARPDVASFSYDSSAYDCGVDMSATKYMVSEPTSDGKYYMLLVTAFDLSAAQSLGANSIGYAVQKQGEESYDYFGNKYYTGIIIRESVYSVSDVFGADCADYGFIICEIEGYDPRSIYEYQAVIRGVDGDGEVTEIASAVKKASSVRYTLTVESNGEQSRSLVSGTVSLASVIRKASGNLPVGYALDGIYSNSFYACRLTEDFAVAQNTTVYANVYPESEDIDDWTTQPLKYEGAEVSRSYSTDGEIRVSGVIYADEYVSYASAQSLRISACDEYSDSVIRYALAQSADMTDKSFTVDYKGGVNSIHLSLINAEGKTIFFKFDAAYGCACRVYDADKNDGYYYGSGVNQSTGAEYRNGYLPLYATATNMPNGWSRFSVNLYEYMGECAFNSDLTGVTAVIVSFSGDACVYLDNMFFVQRPQAEEISGVGLSGFDLFWTESADAYAYNVYLDGKLYKTTQDTGINLSGCGTGLHSVYVTCLPQFAKLSEGKACSPITFSIKDKGAFVTSTFEFNTENCAVYGSAEEGFVVSTANGYSYCSLRFPGIDDYGGMFEGKIIELDFKENPLNPVTYVNLIINDYMYQGVEIWLDGGTYCDGITVSYDASSEIYTLEIDADEFLACLGFSSWDVSFFTFVFNSDFADTEIAVFTGAYCYDKV